MIQSYLHHWPVMGKNVYLADSAEVIGQVELGNDVSIWPTVVIRGDVHQIKLGNGTNIQDGTICHVTHFNQQTLGSPLTIGDYVTVGHRAVLHGCTIGDLCLIGINSVVLDDAIIEPQVLLGAGSLVPPGKRLHSGYLYLGSPAKQIRRLTEAEMAHFEYSAKHYIGLKNNYLAASIDKNSDLAEKN